MSEARDPDVDLGYLHDHSRVVRFKRSPIDVAWFSSEGRTPVASLDGEWNFQIDPYDSGLRGEWFRLDGHGSVGPPDYEFSAWPKVPVPGCWNKYREDLKHYEGSAWYITQFRTPQHSDRDKVVIHFGGTSGETIVFVNGQFCGFNENPSVPFAVDATPFLSKEVNVLSVWVSNRRLEHGVPGEFYDWFNYGGIFRSVAVYRVSEQHVRHYRVFREADGRAGIYVELSKPVAASVTVQLGEQAFNCTTDESGLLRTTLDVFPEAWSPGNPRLVDLEIRTTSDCVRDSVGFRTISVEPDGIHINGKPVTLKGVAVHEDHPSVGRSLTTEQRLEILDHVDALGANALRLAHYPHDAEMARLADQRGILLWEEIPVYWHLSFSNPETKSRAMRQMRSLILRDINRASVILWSIGNENPDSDARLAFMEDLAKLCGTEDGTRPITAACLVDVSKYSVSDRLVAALDVVSINEYYGWYYPGTENLGRIFESYTDKPLLVSEFGAGATYVAGDGSSPRWSEEFQADLFRSQFDVLAVQPNLAGVFPWLLYDFPSPRRLNSHQQGVNRKGLITEDRTHKKLAFVVVRDFYAKY